MRAVVEKAGKFSYALEFPFDWETITIIRAMKADTSMPSMVFVSGKWRFSDLALLPRLKQVFPNIEISTELEVAAAGHQSFQGEDERRRQRAIEIKSRLETDFVIRGLLHPTYPYQPVGVEFAINSGGHCIIADSPGVGKTVQAIGYIVHERVPKTLVVAPATAKSVWKKEVAKWSKLKCHVIETDTKLTTDIWNSADVHVISYDSVKKFFPILKALKIDLLVCDESHRIKEPKAIRTKHVMMLSRNIPRFIALTGTPVLNRPRELFTTLNIIAPHEFGDMWKFYRRYCDPKRTPWGWKFDGASNIDELKERISTYFIRRTKEEVLPYLPKKIRVDLAMPLDDETDAAYSLAEQDFVRYLETSKDTKTNVATVLTQLNELRRLACVGKISGAIDFIDDLVEAGEKVIVFSSFNEPLTQLKEYYEDRAVMIVGSTAVKDREAAVDAFQEDDKVRVFLGGLKSAGEGITLTAASSTVFLDYSWVPADQEQASNRNHRPGVKHQSVTIYQMYSEGTIDAKMREINEAKKDLFEKLFGDDSKSSGEMIKGVVDSYRKKAT